LEPTSDYPFYYRAGFFSGGGIGWDGGKLAHCNQAAEADHPLIVCVSREGNRCVATASEDYWFLFHNRRNEHLRCIHSQQSPVPTLRPGETATFRQKVYFIDGGLARSVAAFEADTERDQFQHYRFAANPQRPALTSRLLVITLSQKDRQLADLATAYDSVRTSAGLIDDA
jgi:hypothetical protein